MGSCVIGVGKHRHAGSLHPPGTILEAAIWRFVLSQVDPAGGYIIVVRLITHLGAMMDEKCILFRIDRPRSISMNCGIYAYAN